MTISIDTEGAHPATMASIEALQWLHERCEFGNILEIGCGNGILSILAASIWDARVLAADISPQAVKDTEKAVAHYELNNKIQSVRSESFQHPSIRAQGPYDLIICNLLADVHLQQAHDLKSHLSPGGYCLLSGILAWRTADIEAAYTKLGFEILEKSFNSPWHTYIMLSQNKNIKFLSVTKA